MGAGPARGGWQRVLGRCPGAVPPGRALPSGRDVARVLPQGCDRTFFDAGMQFTNMDLLLSFINTHSPQLGITVEYATLSSFFQALHAYNATWHLRGHQDFLPYVSGTFPGGTGGHWVPGWCPLRACSASLGAWPRPHPRGSFGHPGGHTHSRFPGCAHTVGSWRPDPGSPSIIHGPTQGRPCFTTPSRRPRVPALRGLATAREAACLGRPVAAALARWPGLSGTGRVMALSLSSRRDEAPRGKLGSRVQPRARAHRRSDE